MDIMTSPEKEIMREHRQNTLSPSDLTFILELLDKPLASNDRLKSAITLARKFYNN